VHALPASRAASALEAKPAPSIVAAIGSSAGPPPLPAASGPSSVPSTTGQAANVPISRAPRASRLPKDVVLGVTPAPDPDRWLKKRERTSHLYSGRRARRYDRSGPPGAGMGVGATQGGGGVDLGTIAGGIPPGRGSSVGANPTGHVPLAHATSTTPAGGLGGSAAKKKK
jgi:signal recognition particle subunit SRP72